MIQGWMVTIIRCMKRNLPLSLPAHELRTELTGPNGTKETS